MIEKLKNLIPTTQNEIDRHYYECYGDGSVTIEKTGSTTVYIVKGESFGNYIHSAYGQSVKVQNVYGDVHFRRVDTFGQPWANKYGYAASDSYAHDFSCAGSSYTHKGYGTIDKVTASEIYVNEHNGKRTKLTVGACSRIEAVTELPKAGQNIYYSGEPSSADGYNLILASCY